MVLFGHNMDYRQGYGLFGIIQSYELAGRQPVGPDVVGLPKDSFEFDVKLEVFGGDIDHPAPGIWKRFIKDGQDQLIQSHISNNDGYRPGRQKTGDQSENPPAETAVNK